jgi:hypothetical protein
MNLNTHLLKGCSQHQPRSLYHLEEKEDKQLNVIVYNRTTVRIRRKLLLPYPQ